MTRRPAGDGERRGGMLTKIKNMFRSSGKRPKVNLDRRFTHRTETGQGSMSKVYRCVDGTTGRTVCLKVQFPEKNQAAAARTREARPDEGEVASKVIHPHVVRTFDYGPSTRGEHFLVM